MIFVKLHNMTAKSQQVPVELTEEQQRRRQAKREQALKNLKKAHANADLAAEKRMQTLAYKQLIEDFDKYFVKVESGEDFGTADALALIAGCDSLQDFTNLCKEKTKKGLLCNKSRMRLAHILTGQSYAGKNPSAYIEALKRLEFGSSGKNVVEQKVEQEVSTKVLVDKSLQETLDKLADRNI